MTGIFPDASSGGVITRDAAGLPTNPPNTPFANVPPATFLFSCSPMAYQDNCLSKFSPSAFNAVLSEIVNFAAFLTPNGSWNCGTTNNLALAFAAYLAAQTGGVSTDAGNLLVNGSDGKPYLAPSKFMAGALAP